MKLLQGKLTYANVMVTVLAFIVLGGASAFAATQIAKNSVGTKQLKNGAVTAPKLSQSATAALTGPAGPKGARGEVGPKGAKGDKGDKGNPGTPATEVMWAVIDSDGHFVRENNTLITSGRIKKGEYFVEFERNLSQCSFQATTGSTGDGPPFVDNIGVGVSPEDPTAVRVWVAEEGEFVDLPFHVAVFC